MVNQMIHKAACGGVIRYDAGAWIDGVARNLESCTILMAEVPHYTSAGCPSSHHCVAIVFLINRLKMKDYKFKYLVSIDRQTKLLIELQIMLSIPMRSIILGHPPLSCVNLI
ncbi:hypothetical protein L195_g007613 [Trifolium pratense]|uniref:Uncharacterized protein n=1 Tax=Trifolium pratense TaxID=57577 RepID=A0A2K3P6V6_TRIPR|nr:hypothetical protein L195_g007613 [Trifolium pratense]